MAWDVDENDEEDEVEIDDEGDEGDENIRGSDDSKSFWNEPCSVCDGLHKVVQISEPCSDCEGSGWVEIEVEESRSEECPDCEGSGEIVIKETREV